MRLFVAVNLPEAVRQELWQSAAPLRERGYPVRWSAPEGLHVTLKFLGEVGEARLEACRAALGAAVRGARPLALPMSGFGAFPDARHPRVIWAGVAPEPALELLQDRVEREFGPLGFPPEGRPFRPHISLGRARRGARPRGWAGLDAALAALSFDSVASVSTVELMASLLQRAGAVYQVNHSERLL